MTLAKELEWLYGLTRVGDKGFSHILKALEHFKNPQKKLNVIHITGTNGKGSTAAMTAEVLKRAGYKTGLFTSPHLVRFNERIKINGQEISDEELLSLITEVKELNLPLKFFEFCTVMGIVHFFRKDCQYVVLEVGMGGENDPTNVCDAKVAAITPIGWDHMHILGNSIEEITKEKIGIIKKKSITITSAGNSGIQWIKEKAGKLIVARPYQGVVGLRGAHQRINAGIAFEICKALGVDDDIIEEGIAMAKWAGRLQYVSKNIVVDCAHNLTAMQTVEPEIKKLAHEKLIIVFGVLADKDYAAMIKALPKPDYLILTKPPVDRALDPAQLAYDGKCAVIAEPVEALRYAKSIAKENDLILVIGSCYLAGMLMEALDTEGKKNTASQPQTSRETEQTRQ